MKWFTSITMVGVLFTGFFLLCLPSAYVAKLEENGYYSLGLEGELRLFDFSEKGEGEKCTVEAEEICSFPEEEASFLPGEQEEGPPFGEEVAGEKDHTRHSVFEEGGTLIRDSDEEDVALAFSVRSKVPIEGELIYRSFAFQDRLPPLTDPLTDQELCFVFAEIVASSTLAVPIKGKLEKISFVKEGENLTASADITLCFSLLAEQYHLSWLPDYAHFSLVVPFVVKNSEISVISNKIVLSCESFALPEALLIFGCNVAFGKRDYRTLFGEAIKNVFLNAGIYG